MCLIALSRGLAPPSPLSFCQSFHCFFLHTAESGVFPKVRVCAAQQCNSQQLVCDMQFTVVANKSNCELRWQGASYSGAHPVFVFMETHAVPYATSGSFLRTPNAVVSYKTRPANLARTSQFCVPSELFHLPSSASFNTSCPAQTCGNQYPSAGASS